jgi:hypothetical protein
MKWVLALILAMGGAQVTVVSNKTEFWLHNYGNSNEYCWVELTTRDVEIFMPAGSSSRRFQVDRYENWGCY